MYDMPLHCPLISLLCPSLNTVNLVCFLCEYFISLQSLCDLCVTLLDLGCVGLIPDPCMCPAVCVQSPARGLLIYARRSIAPWWRLYSST
ncbi:hypothetical protein GDO81_015078 [Engystomops pustulosus]|uniref:Secreted protein n=1 Tax=Engystomops pustulosus TaxID=76066 RepID=A0AAV7AL16_ENGPU|nr:hypothetical protein GDO81_015078 [Engystomops pustulosus]